MTEQQIVNGIKNNDRKAMRAMYDLLAGHAMATAMRYLDNRDDCRDVLQEGFLKAFSHMGNFNYRGEGSLKAWFSRIVANESINPDSYKFRSNSSAPISSSQIFPIIRNSFSSIFCISFIFR